MAILKTVTYIGIRIKIEANIPTELGDTFRSQVYNRLQYQEGGYWLTLLPEGIKYTHGPVKLCLN